MNIRECGSTLYVGLQHAIPPTNTKFKPLLLWTQLGVQYTNIHKHRTSYSTYMLTFLGPAKRRKSISANRQKWEFLRFFIIKVIIIIINFKIFSLIYGEISPRSVYKYL